MKKLFSLLCSLLIVVCLAGCSSSNKNGSYTTGSSTSDFSSYDSREYFNDSTGNDDSLDTLSVKSKIIYTASMDFETKDFDKTIENLNEKINSYDGYVINRNIYKHGEDNKYISAYYSIRIPVSNYNAFLSDSETIANVTSLNESADDITDEYIDLSARLENLKLEEETIQTLLEKATEMSDILEIESRLSEIRGDIESYQAQINYYDTVTEYATIDISISQVDVYTSNKSFIQKLGDLLKDSFSSFGDVINTLFTCLLYALPYILIALIIFLIIRKIKNDKNNKNKNNIN